MILTMPVAFMHLYNYLSSGWNMLGKFDLGKITLANGLDKTVFADVRLINTTTP